MKTRIQYQITLTGVLEIELLAEPPSPVVEVMEVMEAEPPSDLPPTLRCPRPPRTLRDLFGLRGDEEEVRHGR